MTSLTEGSAPGAILGSYLLQHAKLSGDGHWQIARNDSQRTVLFGHPLCGTATNEHGQSSCIRAAETLRQKSANRSGQDIPTSGCRERRRRIRGNYHAFWAGHDRPAAFEHDSLRPAGRGFACYEGGIAYDLGNAHINETRHLSRMWRENQASLG